MVVYVYIFINNLNFMLHLYKGFISAVTANHSFIYQAIILN